MEPVYHVGEKASALTEEKLITAMGFPKNRKDISKYRV
jgi:hypothetical protein